MLLAAAVLVAGCGGSAPSTDPIQSVPTDNGIRAKVREASHPTPASFESAKGKTLQQLAQGLVGGPTVALATSDLPIATDRVAFGVIDSQGQAVYGQTAVYVAPAPNKPAAGPYVAPADVLLTQARYRSKQAATAADPFAAVYAAQVPFKTAGPYSMLTVTRLPDGRVIGATAALKVIASADDPIPEVGQKAPKVHTDTLASAKGDVAKIDTRSPPDDMHAVDFAAVVGKKPVALLFATPQLCQSQVCGPVTDLEVQMQAKYGKRMDFIHQEVYKNNNIQDGLRQPLQEFGLQSEPWLFVVNAKGIITARLEGSIGINAFNAAIESGLAKSRS